MPLKINPIFRTIQENELTQENSKIGIMKPIDKIQDWISDLDLNREDSVIKLDIPCKNLVRTVNFKLYRLYRGYNCEVDIITDPNLDFVNYVHIHFVKNIITDYIDSWTFFEFLDTCKRGVWYYKQDYSYRYKLK